MTRKEVSEFIEAGVRLLAPKTEYGRGRLSEWNSKRGHVYPKVWQVTKDSGVNTEFTPTLLPVDSWPIELRIAFKDSQDSTEEQYEDLIDDADRMAQKLIFNYNQIIETLPAVTITSINRTPFIKRNADDITGVILTFTLQAADLTSNCP